MRKNFHTCRLDTAEIAFDRFNYNNIRKNNYRKVNIFN
jgi:hypothetical protein